MSKSGYKRVYEHHGAWFFVDRAGKWHRLCAVEDGEPAMLRALAKHKGVPEHRPGSMPALIADFKNSQLLEYAEVTQRDYGLMLPKIEAALRDLDVAEVDAGHVVDLRNQWRDKPRSANKYQALLSVLMSYAIDNKLRTDNPCRDVRKLKVTPRKVYQKDETTLSVWDAATVGKNGRKTGNGAMYAALFAFAYLSVARAKDCRLLRWTDVGETTIWIEPTKTRGSSAAKIEVAITPDIRTLLERARAIGKVKSMYVFHTLKGGPLSASAVKSAWRRARERAGQPDAWFRDMRAKGLSDAKRRGRSLQELADGAGHASVTTTEGYMRGFEVKKSDLGLTLPARKKVANSGG